MTQYMITVEEADKINFGNIKKFHAVQNRVQDEK